MKLANIKYYSTVNAPGISTAVFVSGCYHKKHCPGCFNKIAWDGNYGHELTDELIDKIIEETKPDYIRSLSILGGEPLDAQNTEGVAKIIKRFREVYGNTKNIWVWTGYVMRDENAEEQQKDIDFEYIPESESLDYILNNIDVLIDGPFVQCKYSIDLKYRGSSNQRVIDVQKTLKEGKVILWEKDAAVAA